MYIYIHTYTYTHTYTFTSAFVMMQCCPFDCGCQACLKCFLQRLASNARVMFVFVLAYAIWGGFQRACHAHRISQP